MFARSLRPVIASASVALAVAAAVLCTSFSAQPAYAVTSAELQAQAQAAYQAVQELDQQYNESAERYNAAVMEQENAQTRIAEASKKIEKLQTSLSNRVRTMYRDGSLSVLDLVFGCTSFEDFATSWDLLSEMNKSDAQLVSETKVLREEVKEQEQVYAEQAAVANEEKESAAAMKAQMEATYNSLSAEAQELYEQERQAALVAAYTEAMENFTGDTSTWTGYTGTWEYDESSGNDILSRAYQWLGTGTYSYGACSEGTFDCSGFVSYCLTGQYTRIGNTGTFMGWDQTSDPQPGDVCVSEGHTGIYIGNGQMIHAASEGEGVVVGPVQSDMIYVH